MDAPSTPPHEAAKKGASKGLAALKKLPPWAWILVAGGFLLIVIYMRHQQQNASSSTAATSSDSATNDGTSDYTDTSSPAYSSDGYDTGYQQGLSDSGYLGGGGLGGGSSGGSDISPPAGAGIDPTILSGIAGSLSTIAANSTIPTGGGMQTTTTATHQTPPSLVGKGAIRAPSGAKAPTAPRGYKDRGLGGGAWEFVPVNKQKKKTKGSRRKGP